MEQNLTNWKKNIDSRYISGEDLQSELKGLKKEMVVVIDKFEDAEAFDQKAQSKIIKTGFFLKELNGAKLYKPVLLNKTNAVFCAKEFGSDFMENWIGKPFILYAKADARHGFVARFKKYYPAATVSDANALATLRKAENKYELIKAWESLSVEEKKIPSVAAEKDFLKNSLKS